MLIERSPWSCICQRYLLLLTYSSWASVVYCWYGRPGLTPTAGGRSSQTEGVGDQREGLFIGIRVG